MGPWVWALARYALILVTRKCVTSTTSGLIVRPGRLATVDDALGEMLSADPYRPSRHDKLSTREWVHRGDIVALHMVQRSLRSCLRAAMSGGHHGLVYV